jgi:hypothetical protein
VAIGVVALVAAAAVVIVFMALKGRRAGVSVSDSERSVDDLDPKLERIRPLLEGRREGDYRFRTSLEWAAELDPKGMIRRFPLERDAIGKCLPLLLAVFDKCYLLKVILPRAVAAVGAEAGGKLLLGVDASEMDDERLRDNSIHIYTRPEIYRETNRLMRLESGDSEPGARLWPFVAILQMAFVKALKDSTGGILYRGGLLSTRELAEVRNSLAAGQEGEIILRGVTSCSRLEEVAIEFARGAVPIATMVRVLFSVFLGQGKDTDATAHERGLRYGPAVSVELMSNAPEEKEVILLDGTVLKVSPGDVSEARFDGFECVRIKARVDWDELGAYFALCDQAKTGQN